MRIIIQSLKIIVLAGFIGLGAMSVLAWTEPTIAPPQNNAPLPINSEQGLQTISGDLIINGYLAAQGVFGSYRDAYFANYSSGYAVGIGTTNPQGKLDVRGGPVSIWDGNAAINDARSEGDLYVENDLEVGGGIYFGNEYKNSWTSGAANIWTTSGQNIYYNSGSVGIGEQYPTGKLDVQGDEVRVWDGSASVSYRISSNGDLYVENDLEVDGVICLNNDCRSSWPEPTLCDWGGRKYSAGVQCQNRVSEYCPGAKTSGFGAIRGAWYRRICQENGTWTKSRCYMVGAPSYEYPGEQLCGT